jgi:hypothetical protein
LPSALPSLKSLPRLKSLTAIVPDGCGPGAHVLVAHQAHVYSLQVPHGAKSGDRFLLHVPSALELKSPNGRDGSGGEWWRAAAPSPSSASNADLAADSSINLLAAALAAGESPRYKPVLGSWRDGESSSDFSGSGRDGDAGFEVVMSSVDVREPLGVTFGAPGGRLVATAVDPEGQCARVGLGAGCRVVSFGGEPCHSTQAFKDVLVDRKERFYVNKGPAVVALQFLTPRGGSCRNSSSMRSSTNVGGNVSGGIVSGSGGARDAAAHNLKGTSSAAAQAEDKDENEAGGSADESSEEGDEDDIEMFAGEVQAFSMDDLHFAHSTEPADACVSLEAVTTSTASATASSAPHAAAGPGRGRLHAAAAGPGASGATVATAAAAAGAALAAEGWSAVDLGGGRTTLWVVVGEPELSTLVQPLPGALAVTRARAADAKALKAARGTTNQAASAASARSPAAGATAATGDDDAFREEDWQAIAGGPAATSLGNGSGRGSVGAWPTLEAAASESVLTALAGTASESWNARRFTEELAAEAAEVATWLTAEKEALKAAAAQAAAAASALLKTQATAEKADEDKKQAASTAALAAVTAPEAGTNKAPPRIETGATVEAPAGIWTSTWAPVFSPRESLPYAGDLKAAMKAANRPAIKAIMEHRAAHKHSLVKWKPARVEAAAVVDGAHSSSGSQFANSISTAIQTSVTQAAFEKARDSTLPYGGDLKAAMKAADRPAIKMIMEHRAAQKARQSDVDAARVIANAASSSDSKSNESGNEGGSDEFRFGEADNIDSPRASPASSVISPALLEAMANESAESGPLASTASSVSSVKPQRSQSPPATRPKSHTVEARAAAVAVQSPLPPKLEQRDAGLRVRAATVEARAAAAVLAERDAEERRTDNERQARGEAARARMEARKTGCSSSKSPTRAKSPAR